MKELTARMAHFKKSCQPCKYGHKIVFETQSAKIVDVDVFVTGLHHTAMSSENVRMNEMEGNQEHGNHDLL